MSTKEVAAQFDQISKVYDQTRDPLDPATLEALHRVLGSAGVHGLLEVGVGTGRIAAPLISRGVEVTGIDASEGMLHRAHSKGIARLVRGSAYALPFPERAFDAALFVHVLHVLETPERALAEGVRVGRAGAFAVVSNPSAGSSRGTSVEEPRRRVMEELRAAGFDLPDRGGPARADRRLIERSPPQEMTILGERDVTEPMSRRLESVALRGNRHTLAIPPAALDAAVAKVRAELGDREITYHRVEALARWTQLPSLSAGEAPASSAPTRP
ncbi:MAG: class I SAM-dependent methyltransferase [Thermoplasmata archaeon]